MIIPEKKLQYKTVRTLHTILSMCAVIRQRRVIGSFDDKISQNVLVVIDSCNV